MDADQLELERQKVQLEERRVATEERTARHGFWTRLGVVLPLAAALVAFGGSVLVQRLNARDALELQTNTARAALALQTKKAVDDFELKVAEILMAAKGPYETRGRAIALRQIFPSRLGDKFAITFNPEDATDRAAFIHDRTVASKKRLLNLLAEHPQDRQQIIETWRRLFPDDVWVAKLMTDETGG
jgi:hypothetical protein